MTELKTEEERLSQGDNTLATARRQAAENMRERAVREAMRMQGPSHLPRNTTCKLIASAIRALPIKDAP